MGIVCNRCGKFEWQDIELPFCIECVISNGWKPKEAKMSEPKRYSLKQRLPGLKVGDIFTKIPELGGYVVKTAIGQRYIFPELIVEHDDDWFQPVRWKPGYQETFYSLNLITNPIQHCWEGGGIHETSLWEQGNCFRTREEAEACAEEIRQVLERRRG